MKHTKYIICALAILFMWSCDTEGLEKVKAYPDSEIVPATVKASPTVVITEQSSSDKEVFTLEWEAADFGYPASVSYSVYFSGPSVSDYPIAENIFDLSFSTEHKPFASKLTGSKKLGLPKGEVSTASVYVTATVGSDFTIVKSDPINIVFDLSGI